MNYHYYSLPRLERSSSLDRVNYESSPGRRIHTMSKNLRDNYQNTRERIGRADSVVRYSFNRALSASPGNISSKEHVPTHSTYSHRRFKRHSLSNENEILPTSSLKAHAPPIYKYVDLATDPYQYNFRRSNYYLDDDTRLYPSYYSNYRAHYVPRNFSTHYNRGFGFHSNLYYPKDRSLYSLSRLPENQYYYRYNVLPYYGYDANDMLRERRRKINSQYGYHSEFHAPPFGFFSGMKKSLNNIHDKMESHKLLLDRYTGIDMAPNSSSVGDNILEKSLQMSYRKRY